MKKLTFGTPEKIVPSKFCKNFNYVEKEINFNTEKITFRETARGCILEMPLDADEQIFGFGLQLKGFNHKNRRLKLKTNSDPVARTGDSHAPVPFFVTNKGYGIYIDSARYLDVFCGFLKKKNRAKAQCKAISLSTEELYHFNTTPEESVMSIEIPGAKGVDIYIFEGKNITEIVSLYNMLSGGGCDVPEWGLGVLYRANAQFTGDEIINLAKYMRENDIPCDIMGLEPGWQTGSYPCTFVWDNSRFPEPQKVISFLKENGFHINLWEHAFTSPASPIYNELFDYCGDYEVWKGITPDFALKEARDIFAGYHKNNIVNMGVDGFKLDECDSGDYVNDWSFPDCSRFPSGMDGEQYHQMFGVLYMQTILQALCGTPTLSEVRNAGALCASYPFVLYSDLYDHKDFIRGIVNSGFSGILWAPELRDAKSKDDLIRRLQSTVFSVQCLINAWYCPDVPWKEFDCENEVRELLKLRKSLVPMLKKAFDEYKETGKPPIRALVSDYTDDKETYSIDDEYIFCDNLIVAPLTAESDERDVYLPEGNWRDYFTKEPVNSGWFKVNTKNIPVYEKVQL